jgi:hypothetical protein
VIAACWIVTALAGAAYGAAVALSTDTARDTAPVFLTVALAAWLVLTIAHNRRHR